jgi:hypothetical protein
MTSAQAARTSTSVAITATSAGGAPNVLGDAGGDGGRKSPEHPPQIRTTPFCGS